VNRSATSSQYLLKLRDLILRNGPDCHISSTHAELQLAIDFSRELYNLQDLSEYPVGDSDDESNSDDDDEDEEDFMADMRLTAVQKKEVREAFNALSQKYTNRFFFWSAEGEHVIVNTISHLLEDVQRRPLFDTVKEDHLEALKKMLVRLKAEKENKKCDTTDFSQAKVRVEWPDVSAAQMYQLVFIEFGSRAKKYLNLSKPNSVIKMYSPLQMFDGRYFHQEMAKLRNPESFKASIFSPTGNTTNLNVAEMTTNSNVTSSTPAAAEKNGKGVAKFIGCQWTTTAMRYCAK